MKNPNEHIKQNKYSIGLDEELGGPGREGGPHKTKKSHKGLFLLADSTCIEDAEEMY